MDVINVLELYNGVPAFINSFVIMDNDDESKKVEEAQNLFIRLIESNLMETLSDKDKSNYIEEANYDDQNGYEIYLSWSLILS